MPLSTGMVTTLIERTRSIADGDDPDRLHRICVLLRDEVEHYDWVGFYLVDKEKDRELVLGPFSGEPTEHTHIAFGQGICGQAAETGRLFLVQDVTKETNYLSCSPEVRSEIVLPIHRDGELVGELDIDSHQLDPFTEADTILLEEICRIVALWI
ncbi:MAG: GAF domain-containing protein [Thermoplasmatota archaeon]